MTFLRFSKLGPHVPQMVRSSDPNVCAWSSAENPGSSRPPYISPCARCSQAGWEGVGNNCSMVCRIGREIYVVVEALNAE